MLKIYNAKQAPVSADTNKSTNIVRDVSLLERSKAGPCPPAGEMRLTVTGLMTGSTAIAVIRAELGSGRCWPIRAFRPRLAAEGGAVLVGAGLLLDLLINAALAGIYMLRNLGVVVAATEGAACGIPTGRARNNRDPARGEAGSSGPHDHASTFRNRLQAKKIDRARTTVSEASGFAHRSMKEVQWVKSPRKCTM